MLHYQLSGLKQHLVTTLGQGTATGSTFLLQDARGLTRSELSVWEARAAGAGWPLSLLVPLSLHVVSSCGCLTHPYLMATSR